MNVKLSVIFITYNHERYVERALRSVLSQRTDFDFEVVIGEDCSTDSTREIIERVLEEYLHSEEPEASEGALGGRGRVSARFVPRKTNTGRPTLNVYETTKQCRGEYLAYIEGDDYWTDPDKLRKQVGFLDAHKEYIACTHSCVMVDENGEEIRDAEILRIGELYDFGGRYTFEDFKYSGHWAGHYATLVSRNIYPAEKYDYTILYRAHDFVDDAVILLFLLIQGDIWRMDECMSAWRYVKKKGGSNWNSLALERDLIRDDCYLSQTMMKWVENAVGLTEYSSIRARKDFGMALKLFLKRPDKENYRFLKDMYEYNIKEVVMKGRKTSLLTFSLRTVLEKLLHGILRRPAADGRSPDKR
ncbi:MAG TPA: hypothetical protein DCL38_05885 [Lachnospiraceae bacterium]|nr:hypothetical protein [Lachnospiraceae bacterium]